MTSLARPQKRPRLYDFEEAPASKKSKIGGTMMTLAGSGDTTATTATITPSSCNGVPLQSPAAVDSHPYFDHRTKQPLDDDGDDDDDVVVAPSSTTTNVGAKWPRTSMTTSLSTAAVSTTAVATTAARGSSNQVGVVSRPSGTQAVVADGAEPRTADTVRADGSPVIGAAPSPARWRGSATKTPKTKTASATVTSSGGPKKSRRFRWSTLRITLVLLCTNLTSIAMYLKKTLQLEMAVIRSSSSSLSLNKGDSLLLRDPETRVYFLESKIKLWASRWGKLKRDLGRAEQVCDARLREQEAELTKAFLKTERGQVEIN